MKEETTMKKKCKICKENKAKFFAQYWNQEMYSITRPNQPYVNNFIQQMEEYLQFDEWYLLLTPISQLREEDALEVYSIVYPNSLKTEDYEKIIAVEEMFSQRLVVINLNSMTNAIDYLRSKGYALQFMNYTVADQLSMGWIQLREQAFKH